MGEQSQKHENGMNNGFGNDRNEDVPGGAEGDAGEVADMPEAEFKEIDNQLDALSAALDNVEQKNDNIFAQLQQLLQSNREIRSQLEQKKDS